MRPDDVENYEKLCLSRRTIAGRLETISENLYTQIKMKASTFEYYPIALDKNYDIDDTAQLIISIGGIYDSFHVTEEMAALL